MKRIILVFALSMTVAGCTTQFGERASDIFSVVSTASAATVDPKAIIVAAGVFDGVEVTATQYLRLPRCRPTSGPVCRAPAATKPIINAVRAGRKARNAALAFVKTHPGQLGPGGLYDALQTAVGTLQSIFSTYGVESTVNR